MHQALAYESVLASSQRGAWRIDDVLPRDAEFDFSRPFLPEAFARAAAATDLSVAERLVLNHVRAHEYLAMFGLVEEFILPFVLDHARPQLSGDDYRVRALLQFAGEEAKHIQLFKRFRDSFRRGFGIECGVIGPAEDIGAEILRHDALSVALLVLQIEWMTQAHYLESVRNDAALEPLFKSLLRHHWMEEAQHAKIDTLMVRALAQGRPPGSIAAAFDGYVEICAFIDSGLRLQAEMNLDAFERKIGRALPAMQRHDLLREQHQASRWTFLGSGMAHPKFRATLDEIAPDLIGRLDAIAPTFT